ncbi:hypothetical protein CONCODRAFT_80900, partial [Conidiobolus coronatus NRRL 28638]
MIKAPNTANNNSNSSATNASNSNTKSSSLQPKQGTNGQSLSKTDTKGNLTDSKLDDVTSEDENLSNYDKYILKRNKTLVTNCPLILNVNGAGTSANLNSAGAAGMGGRSQIQFDSSKLNPETLDRVCKGLAINTSGLTLKQICNKLDKFWQNDYKPDLDLVFAKSLLKVKYDMGLEAKDYNSMFDSDDEFQYFGQSSDQGQSDDDSSEYYNTNNDQISSSQRQKRALPVDGRQSQRVKKRLHYYNIADDPEPQPEEIYQDPHTYLTNFNNNRNLYDTDDLDDNAEEENNDSVLDSKTPTNIDEKTPRGNSSQVDNLREESNYMIEDETQENELEEFEHENEDSQLNTGAEQPTKNGGEANNEDKNIDTKEEKDDTEEEVAKENETTETETEANATGDNEPLKSDTKEAGSEPEKKEEKEDTVPQVKTEKRKEEPLEDTKLPSESEPVPEDAKQASSPIPAQKEKSPSPHDQSSPLPELTDPPTPGQQDPIPQEDGEAEEDQEE